MWKGWITYPRGGELRLLALGVVFSNLAPDRNGLTVSRIVTMSTETLRRLDPYFMAPYMWDLVEQRYVDTASGRRLLQEKRYKPGALR